MDDVVLEPWPRRVTELDRPTAHAVREVTSELGIRLNAEIVEAYVNGIQQGRRMSLTGKMAALTERATKFNDDTEKTLDGISEKITKAEAKRDVAAEKHHAYYDTIIKGVDESVAVIDRLSNGPLPDAGKT